MTDHYDLITDLPAELSSMVLYDWLDLSIRIVARLDSAYCNHQRRPILTKLFKTRITVNCSGCVADERILRWLLLKGIRMSSLFLHYEPTNSFDYFASFGGSIRKFCSGSRNLASLTKILEFTANVEELDVRIHWLDESEAYKPVLLPQLKRLMIDSYAFPDAFAEALSHSGHQLQELRVSYVDNPGVVDGLLSLLRSSPQLRAIALSGLTVQPDIFNQLHVLCPNIVSINLREMEGLLNDGHVTILARHLRLKWLNISYCTELTDQSLEHIAEHCSDTLESFRFDMANNFTNDGVLAFFGKCRKIHTVVLALAEELPTSLDFYERLFSKWQNVTHLQLTGFIMTNNALAVLAILTQRIHYLDVSALRNITCAAVLRPVLLGCPLLRTLIVEERFADDLAILPERLARPHLKVTSEYGDYDIENMMV